jgi:hypothetical protein
MSDTTETPLPRQELWRWDATQLAGAVGEVLVARRRADAQLGRMLAEIDARGAKATFGYPSAATWLAHKARITPDDARATVKRALALHAGVQLDGTVIPPLAPATGAAAAEGLLGERSIDIIVDAVRRLPEEHRAESEETLLDYALVADPAELRSLARQLLEAADPDGAAPEDAEPETPRREAWLRQKRNGRWKLDADLDDVTGALANELIDALSQRRTGEDGPDLRGIAARRGDAVADIVELAMNSDDLPTHAGERVHLMVAMSLEDLQNGVGTATLGDEGERSAAEARLHACDCEIVPVVLGGKSEPLDLGRLRRLITAGHRRALYIRDRGCAFPGCTQPPKHTQGHHIRHWADGGRTDLGNLTLLCGRHHRLMHRSGWEVRIAADGLPEFFPPAHVDPLRRRRRNNLHPPLPFAA